MAWLSGYSYRKPISITGQSGAGTDYQVKLEVHLGSGSDSSGVVYLVEHCQDFPNDIRFADDDGQTELDHWLLPGAGTPREFWIEIQDDLGGNQDFYIYYGKSGGASASDARDTFIVGNDFDIEAEFDLIKNLPQDQVHDVWFGGGYVWTCTRDENDIGVGGYVMRIDPADGSITTKQLAIGEDRIMGGCYALGFVWLALLTTPAKLIKMNPANMNDYTTYTMAAGENDATSVCSDGTYIWMSLNIAPGKLIKFNVATELHTTYAGTASDNRFYHILWDGTYVWTIGSVGADSQTTDGRLVRFEPVGEAFTGYTIGAALSHRRPHHIAYDGTSIWVCFAVSPGKYIKWNIAAGTPTSYTLPAGKNDAYLIEYNSGWLWLTIFGNAVDKLYKIDPSDGSAVDMRDVINRPHGIGFDGDDCLWLANYRYPTAAAAIQRIVKPALTTEIECLVAPLAEIEAIANRLECDDGVVVGNGYVFGTTQVNVLSYFFASVKSIEFFGTNSTAAIDILSLYDDDEVFRPGDNVVIDALNRFLVRRYSNTDAHANQFLVQYRDVGGGLHWWTGAGWGAPTWHEGAGIYTVQLWSDGTNFKADILDSNGASIFASPASIAIASVKSFSSGKVLISGEPYTTVVNISHKFDDYYVRKYIDPEPIVGTAGAEEESPSVYYHGLKVQGEAAELALCDVGSHPLRFRKGGTTYGIELVPDDDPNASRIRIKTPAGIKAIRKYT